MADRLKAAQIRRLGEGRHSDGKGLYLHCIGGSKFWVLRYTSPLTGKRREMGLGSVEDLPLADAREKRDSLRALIRAGTDPLAEAEAEALEDNRLATWITKWFDANKSKLKGDGEAGRWLSPLNVHVIPKLGDKDVTTLRAGHIVDCLRPIWMTKTSAAAKAADRLGIVLRYAAAYVDGVDRMALPDARQQLGDQGHTVTHIEAMRWQDLPAFYATLGDMPTELALRLGILTAARPAPVRLARAEEFDLDAKTWVIPPEKMKFRPTKKRPKPSAFTIPLSDAACAVVRAALPHARDGWLFTARRGKPLSDAAINKLLTSRGVKARAHGFRTSFRTWCQDHRIDRDLAELSLAHVIGGAVEASYARSEMLDLRREVLDRWAAFIID